MQELIFQDFWQVCARKRKQGKDEEAKKRADARKKAGRGQKGTAAVAAQELPAQEGEMPDDVCLHEANGQEQYDHHIEENEQVEENTQTEENEQVAKQEQAEKQEQSEKKSSQQNKNKQKKANRHKTRRQRSVRSIWIRNGRQKPASRRIIHKPADRRMMQKPAGRQK